MNAREIRVEGEMERIPVASLGMTPRKRRNLAIRKEWVSARIPTMSKEREV